MSILLGQDEFAVEAAFGGITTVDGQIGVKVRLSGPVDGRTTIEGDLLGGHEIVTFAGSTSISGGIVRPFLGEVTFEGSTSIGGDLSIDRFDPFALSLVVDILPATLGRTARFLPRLKVDGVEVPVVNGTYDEPVGGAGGELQVRLARVGDRALMVPGAVIEFGYGRKISGAWDEATFITLLREGFVENLGHTIGANGTAWTDSASVRVKSFSANQMATAPEATVIFYDSARVTLSTGDFDILRDTAGNEYPVELEPISGMTLHDLFQKIFLERCDFTAYHTNLPDFPLVRVDCVIGESYLTSIASAFGMYSPVMFEDGGEIWIIDPTLALPAGFPTPRSISVSEYKQLSVNQTRTNFDGFLVQYVENGREWDFVTERNETDVQVVGESGEDSYSSTLIEETWREYRRFANPGVVVKEELAEIDRTVSAWSGPPICRTSETKYYDNHGRYYRRDAYKEDLIPDVESAGDLVMRRTREESERWDYKPHPFRAKMEYVSRHEKTIRGLILRDADNPQLGEDALQEYSVAMNSNNLVDGQTTEFGTIRTQWETYFPLRGRMVRVAEYDRYVVGNYVEKDGTPEERPGEIALSTIAPQQKEVIVLPTDSDVRTNRRLGRRHVGEMPTTIFIPFIRRILATQQTRGRTLELPVIGYDAGFRKGMPVHVTGRTPLGESLDVIGNFLILGRSIPFSSEGVEMYLTCKELDSIADYVFGAENPVGSFTFSMEAGGTATLTVQIDCRTDYQLRSDGVSFLTVEARKVGDVSWVNIETGEIDLSAFDATRQAFEIRLTAAAVSEVTRRSFSIHVEHF